MLLDDGRLGSIERFSPSCLSLVTGRNERPAFSTRDISLLLSPPSSCLSPSYFISRSIFCLSVSLSVCAHVSFPSLSTPLPACSRSPPPQGTPSLLFPSCLQSDWPRYSNPPAPAWPRAPQVPSGHPIHLLIPRGLALDFALFYTFLSKPLSPSHQFKPNQFFPGFQFLRIFQKKVAQQFNLHFLNSKLSS